LSRPLETAIFRIIPIGFAISLFLGLALWALGRGEVIPGSERFALSLGALSLLVTISAAALFVSSRALGKWFRRPSPSETNLYHERFRLVMNNALFVTLCILVVTFLALAVFGVAAEMIVEIAGAVILLFTIAVLVICSRYTAVSFGADLSQVIKELRASTEMTMSSYQAMAEQLSRDVHSGMIELSDGLQRQGERQASAIEGLSRAMESLAERYAEAAQITEDVRQIQEEAAEEARQREEEEQAARERREEQERIRMMPRLLLGMSHAGVVFHHLNVRVANQGMPGFNLRVAILVNDRSRRPVSATSIASQEPKTWNIGDVGEFPVTAQFIIVARVSDAAGRTYSFQQEFQYRRRVSGILGRTVGVSFLPAGLIAPRPVLEI
jgi:hypothetical protein